MQQNQFLVETAEHVIGQAQDISPDDEPEQVLREIAMKLHAWAENNRTRLKLDPDLPISVWGAHPVHRIASGGELLVEMVAHFVQTQKSEDDLGGLRYRSGFTLIANIDGQVRFVISKSFHEKRIADLRSWVGEFDNAGGTGWPSDDRDSNRMMAAFSARAMDRKRWR